MTVQSLAKGVRISPRKVSEVVALVRGRSVSDAVVILEHTPRRAAKVVKNAVISARSNAEHNHNFRPDSLFISEITVTAGPRFKRYRPAARGRALPFQRKTSHLRVVVDGEKRVPKKKPAISGKNEESK